MSDYDDEDAWSYSFPPSSDSLPLNKDANTADSNDKSDKPDLNKIDEKLNNLSATSPASGLGIDILKANTANGNNNGNTNGTSNVNGLMRTGSASPSIGSLPLQSPFLSKSTPANPLTTKEDASSIISKDSKNSNALSSLELTQEDNLVDKLLESPKKSYFTRPNSSISNTTVLDHKRTNTASEIGLGLEKSPQIIAYRKSRRTTSEGNYEELDVNSTPPEKFDNKLYVDEKFKDTKYRYTTIKRNTDYHQLFRSLDLTDRLLDDFACALSREILLQGRIYISETYICFNSSLLGWITNLIIEMDDIVRFEKRATAGIFPNGIMIETKDTKHVFASFISRDSTFDFMKTVWEKTTGRKMTEADPNAEGDNDDSDDDSKVRSFIMSLDGDDEAEKPNPVIEGDGLISDEDSDSKPQPSTNNIEIVKFKADSVYKNNGPEIHKPTEIDDAINENEIELCNEVIEAPMGMVFEILFGDNSQPWFEKFLNDHDSDELTGFGKFPSQDKNQSRNYTYKKSLGYSIGPKSTICQVEEVIEHLNFEKSILVTTVTKTPDVPLGNSFSVKNIYRFSWGKKNTTNLQISFFIEWTGRSWIKNIIEKSTLTGQTDSCKDLIVSLKKEIEDNTTSVSQPSTIEISELEKSTTPEPKPVEVKPEPVATFSTNTLLRNNIVFVCYLIVAFLAIIIILQLLNFRINSENNILIKQQITINKLLIELLKQNANVGHIIETYEFNEL